MNDLLERLLADHAGDEELGSIVTAQRDLLLKVGNEISEINIGADPATIDRYDVLVENDILPPGYRPEPVFLKDCGICQELKYQNGRIQLTLSCEKECKDFWTEQAADWLMRRVGLVFNKKEVLARTYRIAQTPGFQVTLVHLELQGHYYDF